MSQHRTSAGAVTSIQSVQREHRARLMQKQTNDVHRRDHTAHESDNGRELIYHVADRSAQPPESKRMRLSSHGQQYISASKIVQYPLDGQSESDKSGPSVYTYDRLVALYSYALREPLAFALTFSIWTTNQAGRKFSENGSSKYISMAILMFTRPRTTFRRKKSHLLCAHRRWQVSGR